MNENIKKLLNNRKVIIASWVFLLTTFIIGFSYSAFFTIKTNQNNQTVTTGNLSVAYGGESTSVAKVNMTPMSDEEGMSTSENSVIYIQNNGTLNANYVLNIGYDIDNFLGRSDYKESDELTPIDYIKIAVYEFKGIDDVTLISGPISLGDLPVFKADTQDSRKNRYSLLFGTLDTSSNATKTYQIKMWLSDKASPDISNSYFYLNSEVVAEATESKMAYNLNCVVYNSSNSLASGATISFQNNSLSVTSDENGEFTLPDIFPGTYNLAINYNNKSYEGNITVREGDKAVISSLGTTFIPNTNMNLASVAYSYGTTVNKLIKANNITTNSNNYVFQSATSYNLTSSYIITGATEKNISTIKIVLDDNKINSINLIK